MPQEKKGRGYLFKTIRADKYDFWEEAVQEFIDPEKQEYRTEKRLAKTREPYSVRFNASKKKYEVTSTHPKNRKSLYSEKQKRSVSKHQSFSYAYLREDDPSENYTPQYFGWNRERKDVVVGVCLDPKDSLLWWISMYDAGTYYRSRDFPYESSAEEYIKTALEKKSLHTSFDSLAEYGKTKPDNYNEILAGVRWNCDGTSKIVIFSNNLESRLLAQLRAFDLKRRLEKRYPEKKPISVPIVIYPDLEKLYSEEAAKTDITDVNTSNTDEKLRLKSYLIAMDYLKNKDIDSTASNMQLIDAAEITTKICKADGNQFLSTIIENKNIFNEDMPGMALQKLVNLASNTKELKSKLSEKLDQMLKDKSPHNKLNTDDHSLLLPLYKMGKVCDHSAWHDRILTTFKSIPATTWKTAFEQSGFLEDQIFLTLANEPALETLRAAFSEISVDSLANYLKKLSGKEDITAVAKLIEKTVIENDNWRDRVKNEMRTNSALFLYFLKLSQLVDAPVINDIILLAVKEFTKDHWLTIFADRNCTYSQLEYFVLVAKEKEAEALRFAFGEILLKLDTDGKKLVIERILSTEPVTGNYWHAENRRHKLFSDMLSIASMNEPGCTELRQLFSQKMPSTFRQDHLIESEKIFSKEVETKLLLNLANSIWTGSDDLRKTILTVLIKDDTLVYPIEKNAPVEFAQFLTLAMQSPEMKNDAQKIIEKLSFNFEHKYIKSNVLESIINKLPYLCFDDMLKTLAPFYFETTTISTIRGEDTQVIRESTHCLSIIDEIVRKIDLKTVDLLKISLITTLTLFLHQHKIYTEDDKKSLKNGARGLFSNTILHEQLQDACLLLNLIKPIDTLEGLKTLVTNHKHASDKRDDKRTIAIGESKYSSCLRDCIAAVEEYEYHNEEAKKPNDSNPQTPF